jgi:hypothetical protein
LLARYLRVIATWTALGAAAIIAVTALYYLAVLVSLTPRLFEAGLRGAGFGDYAAASSPTQYQLRSGSEVEVETQAASASHRTVSGWVLNCLGLKHNQSIPQRFLDMTYLVPADFASYGYADPSDGVREPYRLENAIVALSQTLARQRIVLRARVESAYRTWETFTLIAIALGMITTIIVSLSSTVYGRGEGRVATGMRILAVVMPALGTAVTAVIAFYGPQAEYNQESRTLASVRQLHGQMEVGVGKLRCIEHDKGDDPTERDASRQVNEWSNRYADIQAISLTTNAAAGSAAPQQQQQQPQAQQPQQQAAPQQPEQQPSGPAPPVPLPPTEPPPAAPNAGGPAK